MGCRKCKKCGRHEPPKPKTNDWWNIKYATTHPGAFTVRAQYHATTANGQLEAELQRLHDDMMEARMAAHRDDHRRFEEFERAANFRMERLYVDHLVMIHQVSRDVVRFRIENETGNRQFLAEVMGHHRALDPMHVLNFTENWYANRGLRPHRAEHANEQMDNALRAMREAINIRVPRFVEDGNVPPVATRVFFDEAQAVDRHGGVNPRATWGDFNWGDIANGRDE